MISIGNHLISATLVSKGAELTSLKKVSSQTEYLWQADSAFWARHSPVLFPFVGRLRGDRYYHEGKEYTVTQHGFARDMDFELVSHKDTMASFELTANEETRKIYPFDFSLMITYEVIGNQLAVSYEVTNQGEGTLLFSIGAHPAFNCPLDAEEQREDYAVRFSQAETADTQLLDGGVRSGVTAPVLQGEQTLPITPDLFDQDALIFEKLTSQKVTLQGSERDVLSVHFEGFPYLGIWSKSRTSPFVCIEPWYGIADSIDHDQELVNKEGILSLPPAGKHVCSYQIEIH